ncbi:MAG: hypothetical protein AAGH41_00535 [Pseudomonadota bacterium]
MIWRLSIMIWFLWGGVLGLWLVLARDTVAGLWQTLSVLWAVNGGALWIITRRRS